MRRRSSKPYGFVPLDDFRDDMFGADLARRSLVSAARNVLKVDPWEAMGVFAVHEVIEQPGGWRSYLLEFPRGLGELEYAIEEGERLIVLRRAHWRY
jgi:hypothetical protein